jgi:hypothetical protein
MRSTTTGEVQSQESRSVPVASSVTAQTPNTIATVMRTTSSGECQSWCPDHLPCACRSSQLDRREAGSMLKSQGNRWERWETNPADKCQERTEKCKSRKGQCNKGMHLETDWPTIDVLISYSEREIMSHAANRDLHYKMCPATIEGWLGQEAMCPHVRGAMGGHPLQPLLLPPAMYAWESRPGQKKRQKEKRKMILCSCLQQMLACLLSFYLELFITLTQISLRKIYFGLLSSLCWLLSCFTVSGWDGVSHR